MSGLPENFQLGIKPFVRCTHCKTMNGLNKKPVSLPPAIYVACSKCGQLVFVVSALQLFDKFESLMKEFRNDTAITVIDGKAIDE